MSLAYKFRKAERLLRGLNAGDRGDLQMICHRIRDAQAALKTGAGQQMDRCIRHCGGICCRNIELEPIIGHLDLIFIMALAPGMRSRIRDCLIREDPLFRTDCIFLEGGQGPCIFPENVRPEVCVVTFCQYDRPIRREIRQVKRTFFQLSWFVMSCTARAHLRPLTQAVTAVRALFGKTV